MIDILAFDPDGSWDNGFGIKIDLLQTKFFANYTTPNDKDYYSKRLNIYPSLNTPPADNYEISVKFFNITDG